MFRPFMYIPGRWFPYRAPKSWAKNRYRYMKARANRISVLSLTRGFEVRRRAGHAK